MRSSIASVCFAAAGLLMSAASAQEPATAAAQLQGLNGEDHGSVSLSQTPHGVLLVATLRGLPEGVHGFHVHETGECEPPFKSAGGHFNPTDASHGLMNPDGMHAGDMPNIHVPASGDLQIEVLNPQLSLDPDEDGNLIDDDGSAILVHSGADDYTSDPAGNAGDRIACGVITTDPAR